MTTFVVMSQRRCLMSLCSPNVIFTSRGYSSTSRNNSNVSVNPVVDKKQASAPKPKASKQQIRIIKKLHQENKALFGELLESKQEKVKRIRKETKLIKQLSSTTSQGKKSLSSKKALASTSSENEASSKSNVPLPYYNPNRKITANDCTDDGGDYDDNATTESSMVTSFPFPFSPTKDNTNNDHETEASKTPASSSSVNPLSNSDAAAAVGVLHVSDVLNSENNTSKENKEVMMVINKNESPQLPLASVKLPSVSRILNATMPKEQAEALKRWEHKMIAQMGVEGFRLYKEGILTNGKSLHSNIESYLRGTPLDELHIAEPNQGHWNSLNAVLASVDHVHVLESHVIHPKLQYCGVIDCVAEFRNRLVLIDWKTSQKPKPFVSMTYDTPLQIAAYIGAINYDERYSLKIDDGLIVVAYEDGSSCQTFLLSSMDVEKYWKLWLNRLQLYKKLNPPL